MHRHTVKSTALQSVGYDEKTRVLELEFKENGGVWQYFGFKPSTFRRFINAESLGNFFVTNVKGNIRSLKLYE